MTVKQTSVLFILCSLFFTDCAPAASLKCNGPISKSWTNCVGDWKSQNLHYHGSFIKGLPEGTGSFVQKNLLKPIPITGLNDVENIEFEGVFENGQFKNGYLAGSKSIVLGSPENLNIKIGGDKFDDKNPEMWIVLPRLSASNTATNKLFLDNQYILGVLDSRTKCNWVERFGKDLVRCVVSKSLSGTIIKKSLDFSKFRITDG
jgi:hypothetical protein